MTQNLPRIDNFDVDVKQPQDFQLKMQREFPEVKIKSLGTHLGDVRIEFGGKLVVIETKEVEDFIASIMDKRLFLQAEGIRATTPWAFLLHKEFHYDDSHHLYMSGTDGYKPHEHWNRDHVEGALTAVQARGLITRTAYDGWANSIRRIIRWVDTAENGSISREVIKLSPFDEADQNAVNLLTYFDGVGIEMAKSFLKWAGKRPLYKYLELATRNFGKEKPKGWTNSQIQKNRKQLGMAPSSYLGELTSPEWHEELS